MNEQTTNPIQDRLSLYAAWSEDCESGSPRPLSAWIEEYPDHEQEIIHWALQESVSHYCDTLPTDPKAESRFIEKGNLLIAEWKKNYEIRISQPTETVNYALPILSLTDAARRKGLKLWETAQRLEVGLSVLLKMENHAIVPETITPRFFDNLAKLLDVKSAQLRDFVQRPPQLATSAMYKSEAPPQVTLQETFADAIASDSEMTDEQKREALSTEA